MVRKTIAIGGQNYCNRRKKLCFTLNTVKTAGNSQQTSKVGGVLVDGKLLRRNSKAG